MQSELYRTILEQGFEKGLERGLEKGLERGVTQEKARTIVRILARRLGRLDPGVRARVEAETDLLVLEPWYDEALGISDEASAQRLIDQIRQAPPAQALSSR
jgi:flagellar biosynthesis/type III secretory pathway protein FliH